MGLTLSVLLPVYNGAAYLGEALQSLQAQTYGDFELLVVDDGSTDATPELLRAFARRDGRLRVLTLPEPAGLVAALNAGLEAARGELIARMDADDLAHPDRFRQQVAVLAQQPGVVAVGSQIDTFGRATRHLDYPLGPDQARAYALFACPFKHPAVMFRRAAVQNAGGYHAHQFPSEDYGLWVRLLAQGDLMNLPDTLLSYRLHAGSITASRHTAMRISNVAVLREALAPLGLSPTEPELQGHERLGLARFDDVPVDPEQRTAARQWADRLRAANRATSWVPVHALEFELERRLHHLTVSPG